MGYKNAPHRRPVVGDAVVYRAWPGGQPEDGTVSKVIDGDGTMVFVRYANQREDAPGKATRTCDLEVQNR